MRGGCLDLCVELQLRVQQLNLAEVLVPPSASILLVVISLFLPDNHEQSCNHSGSANRSSSVTWLEILWLYMFSFTP